MYNTNNIVDILRSRLVYNPNTGLFFWKDKPDQPQYNSRWCNQRAMNTVQKRGKAPYGRINGTVIKARDAAFAIIHGEFRTDLYHWNKDVTNTRIFNIRARGYSQTGGFPPEYLQRMWEAGYTVRSDTLEVVYRHNPHPTYAPSNNLGVRTMNDIIEEPLPDMHPDDEGDDTLDNW